MRIRLAGAFAGFLTIAALVPALAHAAGTYTIRVEGATRTLLPETKVTVPADSGAIPGADPACHWDQPAGPLEVATAGNWDRALSPPSSFTGLVETVLGETHTGASSWFLWVNGLYGSGICFQQIHSGDDVLLMASDLTPSYDPVDLPLSVAGVPASVTAGTAFTVTVTEPHPDASAGYYASGTGVPTPAAGVTVTLGTATATTDVDGRATIAAQATGNLTLQATRGASPSRSRSYAVCATTGSDGLCGSTAPVSAPAAAATVAADRTAPVSRLAGLTEGRKYAKGAGPRRLSGRVADPSGILMVKLRITRNDGGRCSWFSGRSLEFRGMRCGAEHGSWFKLDAAGDWSYLLPERLPRGRYVVDVNAIDRSYNRDDERRRGSNRVVFTVG